MNAINNQVPFINLNQGFLSTPDSQTKAYLADSGNPVVDFIDNPITRVDVHEAVAMDTSEDVITPIKQRNVDYIDLTQKFNGVNPTKLPYEYVAPEIIAKPSLVKRGAEFVLNVAKNSVAYAAENVASYVNEKAQEVRSYFYQHDAELLLSLLSGDQEIRATSDGRLYSLSTTDALKFWFINFGKQAFNEGILQDNPLDNALKVTRASACLLEEKAHAVVGQINNKFDFLIEQVKTVLNDKAYENVDFMNHLIQELHGLMQVYQGESAEFTALKSSKSTLQAIHGVLIERIQAVIKKTGQVDSFRSNFDRIKVSQAHFFSLFDNIHSHTVKAFANLYKKLSSVNTESVEGAKFALGVIADEIADLKEKVQIEQSMMKSIIEHQM